MTWLCLKDNLHVATCIAVRFIVFGFGSIDISGVTPNFVPHHIIVKTMNCLLKQLINRREHKIFVNM